MTPRCSIVVMGVSGCGKSTIGKAVADHLAYRFLDADDFHPSANLAKMAAGRPLDDDDRVPWLSRLNEILRASEDNAAPLVLACSALKRRYRQALRARVEPEPMFAFLDASYATIRCRMGAREHFMPPALLESQFETLEAPSSDEALTVDASLPVSTIVGRIVAAVRQA
ncbi:MAG: gluconokinase [Opitutales bacterium]